MNNHVFSIMVGNLRTSVQFTRTFFGHRVHSTDLICWRLKEDREGLKMVDIELCKTATWIMQCYCGPILAVSLVYSERYSLTLLYRSAVLLTLWLCRAFPLPYWLGILLTFQTVEKNAERLPVFSLVALKPHVSYVT